MKKKNKIIYGVATLLLGATIFAYLTLPSAPIDVKPNDSRNHVHEVYGSPCGTYYFKCCGLEIGDKMAVSSDIWAQPFFLGQYRTEVYFDEDDKAVESKMGFQWFYEPTLYGFEQRANSCEQAMKATPISRQFKSIKNYLH